MPISFSQFDLGCMGFYEMLKSQECFLSGLSVDKVIASGELPKTRISRQQIIGEFFHSLLDKTDIGADRIEIAKVSSEIIHNLNNKYKRYFELNNTDKIEEWSEISLSMRHALRRYRSYGGKNKVNTEKLLYSKNKKFKGKPDIYIIESKNSLLIDYKSSSIYVDNIPDPAYVLQLEFYGMLIFENYDDVQNIECKLIGLRGEEFVMLLERHDSYSLFEKFNEIYELIKKKINTNEATMFKENSCRYCNYKVICPSFLSNIEKLQNNSDYFILKGTFIGTKNVKNSLILAFDCGHLIVPIDYQYVNLFKTGHLYCVSDLVKRLDGFALTNNSEIYEY